MVVLICTIFGFVPGLILFILIDNIIILILPLLIGVLVILCTWYAHYYHRPDRVIVRTEGIDLHFRHLKPISFGWADLIAVYADPNAKSSIFTNFEGYGGSLLFRVNEPYHVGYKIASAVKEAYRTSTGTYPIEWDGYENYKKLRKRVLKSGGYRSV